MSVIGPLMAEATTLVQHDAAPADLQADLSASRRELAHAFAADVPESAYDTDAVFVLLRWWVRLYGHVALEVFGRFPFALVNSDRLYESQLDELAAEIGIG